MSIILIIFKHHHTQYILPLMDKQSRKLLLKAVHGYIASLEVVTTNGKKSLVFDLISKRQKLYSIVLYLQLDGLVSTTSIKDDTSTTKLLSQYTGLSVDAILIDHENILICTKGIYLHINLNTGKLTDVSNHEGINMHKIFVVDSNGF